MKALVLVVFLMLFATQTNGLQVDMDCQDPDKCGEHGKCIKHIISANETRNQCQCEETYISLEKPCDYKQKRQLVAFLLSLFLGPFGADWFYLSQNRAPYIGIGVTKLLFSIWPIVLCCTATCSTCMAGRFRMNYELRMNSTCVTILGCCICCICVILILGPGVWWIADFARILAGTFPDGNSQDLFPF